MALQSGDRVSVLTLSWGETWARALHGEAWKTGRTDGVVIAQQGTKWLCDFGEADEGGAHHAWARSALRMSQIDVATSLAPLTASDVEAQFESAMHAPGFVTTVAVTPAETGTLAAPQNRGCNAAGREALDAAKAEGLTLRQSHCDSGYTGVRQDKRRLDGKVVFTSFYSVKAKHHYLGIYDTAEEAALVRARKLKTLEAAGVVSGTWRSLNPTNRTDPDRKTIRKAERGSDHKLVASGGAAAGAAVGADDEGMDGCKESALLRGVREQIAILELKIAAAARLGDKRLVEKLTKQLVAI